MEIKHFFIFLLLLSFLSCGIKKYNEIEPNNSRYDAQFINIPIQLKGEIKNANDVDYYKFIVDETNMAQIELRTYDANPLEMSIAFHQEPLKKYYLQPEELENNEKKIIFKNILLKKGIYYVGIELNNLTLPHVNYELMIALEGVKKNNEAEPNDQLVQANRFNIEQGYIKGYFNPPSNYVLEKEQYQESDWFMVPVNNASNILSLELTSVPKIDSVMELYNTMGYLLKKVDSGGMEEPEVLKNLGISEPGDYYIKVFHNNTTSQNYEIFYQLYLSLNPKNSEFEYENNDLFNSANPLNGNIYGYINPVGDKDYFVFVVNKEKSIYHISITPINQIDLQLNIYNMFREKMITLNSGSLNEGELLPNLLLKEGKYYIEVSDVSNRSQNYNDYYALKIMDKGFNPFLEYEPNNAFNSALPIQLKQSYAGYLTPKGDKDYFVINLETDTSLKIDISPVPQINFKLLIYDNSQTLVKEIIGKGKGDGISETVPFLKGNYYLILTDADNSSNSYENYVLSLYER